MDLATQLLALAVLATAEICAEPIDSEVGELQFCRVNSLQEISTPYFSITVEPNFLVGVDRQGGRIQVQSTLSQSQDHLLVELIDDPNQPNWEDCPEITVRHEDGISWVGCHIAKDGMYERRLIVERNGRRVLIQYSYTSLGTPLGPALERMTQSIRVDAI